MKTIISRSHGGGEEEVRLPRDRPVMDPARTTGHAHTAPLERSPPPAAAYCIVSLQSIGYIMDDKMCILIKISDMLFIMRE